jgi:hypothetical protein
MRSNRADKAVFSLTPGFSQVLTAAQRQEPFQPFLAARMKPLKLKRFKACALLDTQLKLGVNEI